MLSALGFLAFGVMYYLCCYDPEYRDTTDSVDIRRAIFAAEQLAAAKNEDSQYLAAIALNAIRMHNRHIHIRVYAVDRNGNWDGLGKGEIVALRVHIKYRDIELLLERIEILGKRVFREFFRLYHR
ncbi:MAG: hypothetical protein SFX18_18175 [Pirellulales bacterium]|nr:hypothetical protein [Pirellulales bacterium]